MEELSLRTRHHLGSQFSTIKSMCHNFSQEALFLATWLIYCSFAFFHLICHLYFILLILAMMTGHSRFHDDSFGIYQSHGPSIAEQWYGTSYRSWLILCLPIIPLSRTLF
jgi:uncharacterized membrane protein